MIKIFLDLEGTIIDCLQNNFRFLDHKIKIINERIQDTGCVDRNIEIFSFALQTPGDFEIALSVVKAANEINVFPGMRLCKPFFSSTYNFCSEVAGIQIENAIDFVDFGCVLTKEIIFEKWAKMNMKEGDIWVLFDDTVENKLVMFQKRHLDFEDEDDAGQIVFVRM